MMTKVYAHKGIGVDCKLAGGISVTVPAGGVWEGNLTGDQIGKVEAYLSSQQAHTRLGPTEFGGRIVCPEREAAPPKKSKAGRRLEALNAKSNVKLAAGA